MISFLLLFNLSHAQKKFKIEVEETGKWTDIYSIVDEHGQVIKRLDTSKYYVYMGDGQYGYFAILGSKHGGAWVAIDANEKVLFKVYNTSFGEPSPDVVVENRIRIVDENERIGFADHKGQIIIPPQYEFVTSFHNRKAIIGQSCKKEPWTEHGKETDCQHYSIECRQYGYIDSKGKLIKKGEYSFNEIMKEIGWKAPD